MNSSGRRTESRREADLAESGTEARSERRTDAQAEPRAGSEAELRAEARLRTLGQRYLAVILRLVEGSGRHARSVVVAAAALLVAASYYSATHFDIDSDTSGILSHDLPFQRQEQHFEREFPQTVNTLVVVIDGESSALAAGALDRLAAWARAHPSEFAGVYAPGGEAFFQRNGLLFLDPPQLQQLTDRIAAAQPLIASLAQDASLQGLFGLLDTAIRQRPDGGAAVSGLVPLFDRLTGSIRAALAGRQSRLPWDTLMAGGDGVASARQRFLILDPVRDLHSLQPAAGPIRALRAEIVRMRLDRAHGIRIGLTGDALLDNEQIKTVADGAGMALGLTLGLELLLLAVSLRSVRLVAAVLLSLIAGMILTTALALILVGPFNLLSVAFAVLFIGLGVDFGIQFCLRYREEVHDGAPHATALRIVATGLGGALSLATFAAAISFFSFIPTRYAGMMDLGLISGIGMFVALLTTITLLPALLSLWPLPAVDAARSVMHVTKHDLAVDRHPIHRYGRRIIVGAAVLFVASLPWIAQVRFDFNPLDMIDPNAEGVRVFHKLLQDRQTSPYRIEIVMPDRAAADHLADRLERLPEVSQALTLASFVPAQQGPKLDILQNFQMLVPPFSLDAAAVPPVPGPGLPAAVARLQTDLDRLTVHGAGTSTGSSTSPARHDSGHYSAALRRSAASLGAALRDFRARFGASGAPWAALQQAVLGGLPAELNRLSRALTAAPVTLRDLPDDLRRRYVAADGQARVEVFPKADLSGIPAMERFVAAVQAVAPQAAGTPVLLVEGGHAVASAFRQASIIALVGIVCLLRIVLRRWLDMALILIPLLMAAAYTVALMSLLGLPFNLGNIIVLPLLIGLGVAFAIYIVMRWRQGVPIAHLLQTSTPAAVLFSGITTLSSFGSMAVSSDPGMASLGKTLSLALVMVLLCTLVVLPALLMLATPSPSEET